jgi:hypothetical protein
MSPTARKVLTHDGLVSGRVYGLGIYATRKLKEGEVVARAVEDDLIDDVECGTRGAGGAWLGPAMLTNSACAKCANALFRIRCGMRAVVIIKEVRCGGQVFVPYEQDGAGGDGEEPMKCPVCAVVLDAVSTDINM